MATTLRSCPRSGRSLPGARAQTPCPSLRRRRLAGTAALVLALPLALAGTAQAHDSWLHVLDDAATPDGTATLLLSTGNLFPVRETAIAPEYLPVLGCADAQGRALPLRPAGLQDDALRLAAPAGAADCWLRTTAFDVTLEPPLVPVYLREVRPPPETLARWAGWQAEGRPWHERYVKHARIALALVPTAADAPDSGRPPGLDLRLAAVEPAPAATVAGPRAPMPGLEFVALRDGRPFPGFSVELRHERSALGVWRRTDAAGRLAFTPPLSGRWLLRGIDLRASPDVPYRWDSHFATLAFTVPAATGGAAAQPPGSRSSDKSSARSASQTAASAAMASEPPTITPRR